MTPEQVKQDLKDKVAKFMADATEHAMKRIDKLEDSGASIVWEHETRCCNWTIPRLFIMAFGEEIKMNFGLSHLASHEEDLLKKFERLM